ncbi:MAG: cyclic pyranopterin monophosphate synthase MoaC, partial [Phycisphaerales bacterium]|nr:cyclic pyranopterin monophosphate synthase MoaC [Phycisphaerales bacterium]
MGHPPASLNLATMIEIYADGACIGNPGPGGWGAVIVRDGQVEAELSGHEPRTTNNRMEIRAVIEGLRRAPPDEAVRVVSDSEYVIKTQKFGWKKNKNLELWSELDRVAGARPIEWAWTRGHSGDKYNEIANDLAQDAAAAGPGTAPGTASHSDPPARKRVAESRPNESTTPNLPKPGAPDTGTLATDAPADTARPGLTHIDESGRARMVDVGVKDVTERVAVARGAITMRPATLALIRQGGFEKGDVLGVARVAGVMAAKRTHDLIPLCHPIPLTQVTVDFDDTSGTDRIEITATARATWKTGVEMEALTAVTVAA